MPAARRIVSLLPSATEIVCALGLGDRLVGVTHECDFPESVCALPKVTRTLIPTDATSAEIDRLVREQLRTERALYTLDAAMLERLSPDLIVTQALCGVCAVAESEVRRAACALPGAPVRVVNLEPQTLGETLAGLRQVADAAGLDPDHAEGVIRGLRDRVDRVAARSASLGARPRVALLEWLDPPFSSGHWGPELSRLAGGNEGLGREGETSRTLSWESIAAWGPEVVFIACCGFDTGRILQDVALMAHNPHWLALPAVRAGRVYVADGSQYFNRPGPRLVDSLEILAHAYHPGLHPRPLQAPPALRLGAEAWGGAVSG